MCIVDDLKTINLNTNLAHRIYVFIKVSERLLSITGNIYINKHSRLLPEKGEMLMFLNYKMRMLNYAYLEIGTHYVG